MKGVDLEDNVTWESTWEDGCVVGDFYCNQVLGDVHRQFIFSAASLYSLIIHLSSSITPRTSCSLQLLESFSFSFTDGVCY